MNISTVLDEAMRLHAIAAFATANLLQDTEDAAARRKYNESIRALRTYLEAQLNARQPERVST